MSPDAQRIALAERCGWTTRYSEFWECTIWEHPAHTSNGLPDYLNSLDAVHEAESLLPRNKQEWFVDHLAGVCNAYLGGNQNGLLRGWPIVHATAAQRVEALLRTLGLWVDDEAPSTS